MAYFQDIRQTRQFRHRSILLFIILATLPCYIIGAIMLGVAPQDDETTDNATLPPPNQQITTATASVTATSTSTTDPSTPSITPNPTGTLGDLIPTPRQFRTPTRFVLPTRTPTATASQTSTITPTASPTTTATIDVQNSAPVFDVTPADISVPLNETQTVSLSFSDPDDDAVSFTAISNNTNIASITQFGETSFNVTGASTGQATITITLIDSQNAQTQATITVTVTDDVNTPPAFDAQADDVTLNEGESSTVALAFTDADGDTVTFTAVPANPAIATTTSVDAQSFAVNGITAGTTTITITLDDGRGGTASQSITVTVNAAATNNPPTFVTLPEPVVLNEGDSTVVMLQFSDPDNDPVTFVAEGANPSIASVAALNDVSFSVTAVSAGETTVSITLDDGQGGTASHIMPVTVNAVITNSPPVFDFVPELITTLQGDSDIVLIETSDPDGDYVTLTVVSTDPTLITATKIDDTQFTVQGIAPGSTTIKLTLNDGNGGTVQEIVPATITEE